MDNRHHPVVISSFEGSPGVSVIDAYYAWTDAMAAAAMAEEQQLVHVTDLSEARMPTPRVRKRVIEHNLANLAAEVSLAHVIVVPSLGLRTIVQTVARLSRPRLGEPELLFASSLEQGIEFALGLLWEARIPPPFGLDPSKYQRPSR